MARQRAAVLLVRCLEALGVSYVFGIPGAKVDAIFDALEDSPIQLVLCRHEQNAAFMAAAYGRVTGKPGVVLVTSGPGVSNLATGLLTATTEGDPVVALGGNVSRGMLLKESHQNTNNVLLMTAVSKSSVEVAVPEAIPEALSNAFRLACAPKSGACFISLPQDVLLEETKASVILPSAPISYGCAHADTVRLAAKMLSEAKFPVLLLGQEASRPRNTEEIRKLLSKTALPTVGTFQAAGVVSRDLLPCFAGRVGLFHNQPGDGLLDKADLVLTIGFNAIEYDPEIWNTHKNKELIHLDYAPAKIRADYQPGCEVLGDIDVNIAALTEALSSDQVARNQKNVLPYHQAHQKIIQDVSKNSKGKLMHPLHFIRELREILDDDTVVICDVGTVYMWMARYFLAYEPHHLLFSNGQQTLGIALPWAMGVRFAYPNKKIVSMSGDGGFLFSAMELENAVRHQQHFVHFIWTDGTYNMVKEQELMKYHRKSGVDFNPINIVDFAKAFGAKGYTLTQPNDFKKIVQEAFQQTGPILIDVPIDYSDNPTLFASF